MKKTNKYIFLFSMTLAFSVSIPNREVMARENAEGGPSKMELVGSVSKKTETGNPADQDPYAPKVSITEKERNGSKDKLDLAIQARDDDSGVKYVELPGGTKVKGEVISYRVQKEEGISVKVLDISGNYTEETLMISGEQNVNARAADIPVLTAKPEPTKNSIRLDWTMADLKNKTFKVFQKKPGSSGFQTVSTTDLTKNVVVKVLNIYPYNDVPGSSFNNTTEVVKFTNWKGENISVFKSANLKEWMEKPTAESPKGYGKGVILVDNVKVSDFNTNPDKYLKNADGTWKYSVIYHGHWDTNANQALNDTAVNSIRSFINSGRGVLTGHDTVGWDFGSTRGIGKIRSYFNIKVGRWKKTFTADTGYDYFSAWQTKKINVQKKGLLTNYPWSIGEIGTKLNVPLTHNTSNFAFGDIWMNLVEYTSKEPTLESTPSWLMPNATFYLNTWNNTAMIQTGHSNGDATADEQKLLANTLFYLNQLSTQNYLDDNSGQDIASPGVPSIKGTAPNGKGVVTVNTNGATDTGSAYQYYVEAHDKNGTITKSNTVSPTITSGIKGYSYIVDTSATTIPNDAVNSTAVPSVGVSLDGRKEAYLHIKAIDNAGNNGSTVHYKVSDTTAPSLTITSSNTAWTKGDVILTAQATDSTSGVKSITLPNGQIVNGTTATYTATSNGDFTFKTNDYSGNVTTKAHTVSNIDKTAPTGTIAQTPTTLTNGNVTLKLTATDVGSGIASIRLPNGTTVTTTTAEQVVTANGTYDFIITDKVGNTKTVTQTVSNIDKTAPTGTIVQTPTTLTNGNVTLKLTATDVGSGVASVRLPNGTTVTNATAEQVITTNGTYSFVVTDRAGNTKTVTHAVSNIDKVVPMGTIVQNPTALTNSNVTLRLTATDVGSGVASIRLPNGTIVTTTRAEQTVTANGTYNFVITDKAGNTKTVTHVVSNIDKVIPSGRIVQTPTTWTNGDVTLKLTATDVGSGVASIRLPNGTTVTTTTAEQTVIANGTYSFIITDKAGNTKTVTHVVSNIDKAAPTGAIIQTPTTWTNGNVTLKLTSADVGSGVASVKLPNGTIVTTTTAEQVVTTNGTYSFVITDKAGNTKTVTHVVSNIDKITPSGTIVQTPTTWTNGNVTLRLTATDAESGIASVKLPNGTTVTTTTAEQVVTTNGSYSFVVTDNAGNTKTVTHVVSNIDKITPSGSVVQTPTTWTNGNVTLRLTATDAESGVASIKLPNGTTVIATAAEQVVTSNGVYSFVITDKAGMTKTVSHTVTNIDKTIPGGSITQTPTTWTNGNVTLKLSATDVESGVASVKLPNGTTVTTATAEQVVTANGTYSFVVTDRAGNTKTVTHVVSNIDKIVPSGSIIQTPTTWTNGNVTLKLTATDAESGIASIKLPNGTTVATLTAEQVVASNGTYSFVVTDKAGNTKTVSHTVSNIDKVAPGGTITQTPTTWTNGKVVLDIKATDNLSGVKQIKLPDGKIVAASVAKFEVATNGSYSFEITDQAGNIKVVVHTVSNIDKVPPVITFNSSQSLSAWTGKDYQITATVVDNTGEAVTITSPDGISTKGNNIVFIVNGNGSYTVTASDSAGNGATATLSISNIDKNSPSYQKTSGKSKFMMKREELMKK